MKQFKINNPLGLNYQINNSTLKGYAHIFFFPPIILGVMYFKLYELILNLLINFCKNRNRTKLYYIANCII